MEATSQRQGEHLQAPYLQSVPRKARAECPGALNPPDAACRCARVQDPPCLSAAHHALSSLKWCWRTLRVMRVCSELGLFTRCVSHCSWQRPHEKRKPGLERLPNM
jgi:hypothetical protein